MPELESLNDALQHEAAVRAVLLGDVKVSDLDETDVPEWLSLLPYPTD